MALDREELRDAVNKGLGGGRTDTSDTVINQYLDIAQIRIARNQSWVELQATTDLTMGYTGSAETDKTVDLSSLTRLHDIYSFVIENEFRSVKLEQKTPEQFDKDIPLPEYFNQGVPAVYMLWGTDTAVTWPVVDSAYTARIRYDSWPTPFAQDSSESDLLYKDDMIIFLTLSFLFTLLREEDQANRLFAIYRSELKGAVEDNAPVADLRIRPNFLSGSAKASVPYYLDPFFTGF